MDENVEVPINLSTKIIKGVAITRIPFTSASILPMFAMASYYAGIGDGLFNITSLVLAVLGVLLLHLASNVFNDYFDVSDGTDEKVLDGYDMRLESQVPHLHWASFFLNTYDWEGKDRDDIKGTKMGSEMLLTSNLNLEIAYDDKDKKGLEDEWYAKIQFIHPPRSGPSLQDGLVNSNTWKEEKDMSQELLTKVKRNNKIMVEFKGSSTISRAD